MLTTLTFISSVLPLIGGLIYCRAILRGDARPHRTTKLVILVIGFLSTAALFNQILSAGFFLSLVSTLQAAATFFLSIKRGLGGWSKIDLICLLIALCGIILWQMTQNPIVGLYTAIGADLVGMIPELIKTYRWPETEIVSFFAIDTFAGFLNILATSNPKMNNLAYPTYIFLINLMMTLLVLRKNYLKRPNGLTALPFK